MEPEITFKEEKDQKVEITRPKKVSNAKKDEAKKDLDWQRDRDKQMVRGKFLNLEQPGQPLSLVYKAYKGDPVDRYDFEHGEIKEIPFGLADHLNNNCSTPVYEHITLPGSVKKAFAGHNPDTKQAMKITGQINRFSFQPLNFSERDFVGGSSNRILKVESM